MFASIYGFELRQQFGNPVLWIVAVAFALLGFGAASSEAVQVGGGIGNTMRNAPMVIVALLNSFAALSMLLVTIFVAGGALRDFDNRTAELFFTTPVHKRDYLFGRFSGGFTACIVVTIAAAIGLAVGYFMPWLDQARIGPHSVTPYLWSLGVLLLPNLLFVAALLFCLAVATRSMLATYIGVIAFFAITTTTGVLTEDLDTKWIGALLDPFGQAAVGETTRYWTTSERNTLLPPLDGVLLLNRAIWLVVAGGLLALAYKLFRTDREGLNLWRRKAKRTTSGGTASLAASAPVKLPKVTLQTGFGAQVRQFLHQAWFDAKGVLTGAPLLIMLALGLGMLLSVVLVGDQMYGTKLYPTTSRMTDMIRGAYSLFLVIIVTFYAGELVWRERSGRIAEVTDAFPNADWIALAAKLVALISVIFVFNLTGIAGTMLNQLFRSYTNFEFGLYLREALLTTYTFGLMAALALFFQVIANNKFVGYLLMVIYLVLRAVLGMLHIEDNLFRPFGSPGLPWSDMNGYGHFWIGWAWFRSYWTVFAAILMLVAGMFWVRGRRERWSERLAEAKRRFSNPAPRFAAVVLLPAFLGIGAWIFHNTHVLNKYIASDTAMDNQAEYEKTYRQFKDLAQPRITAIRADVDIYPEERRVAVRGHYRIVNKHDQPISELHLAIPVEAIVRKLEFGEHETKKKDQKFGYSIYTLTPPMAPGEKRAFDWELEYAARGFTNGIGQVQVVENGTFFNNFLFPSFGYQEGRQIEDRNERRKRDLGEVERMAKIDDVAAHQNHYLSDDADWVDFETTVSTSADQIALAPGYLQREWTENGRRYFHYKMDAPMLPFAAWLSARWAVKKSDWNGMPIEVYYDPKHAYNVDRMIEASKKSFDYFNANFTPYQHKQFRILEFPGYSSFAQAFANTIPYSESIGFIADLRDEDAIDYVFYVTAHEAAHQWWAHQVIGADVQGSTVLTESLAQYSALMVMEKEYGPRKMRKFLKYELDNYLRSRITERREELPLALVENQQYIHYRKGSLVWYALRDAIGEDTLNAILKRFLEDKGFQQPPYTDSRELLTYLRDGTDAKFHPLIDDLFEKIVFFDNRLVAANAVKRDDGKYAVTLDLHSAKLEAAGKGEETEMPLSDEIDIGIFARPDGGKEKDETVLYLAKHKLTDKNTTLELVVDEKPFDAGIDPYNKLIDRGPDDNRRGVTVK